MGPANHRAFNQIPLDRKANIDGDMTMSTITPAQPITSPAAPAAPPFADVYRMDIDEFERVADLLKAERVELIDGFIVERAALDPLHVLSSENRASYSNPGNRYRS